MDLLMEICQTRSFEETWIQGAQRWNWRAESGDWKAFGIDWPTGYTTNGTALIDVDWPDNDFTDIDVFWMSEVDHIHIVIQIDRLRSTQPTD